MRNIIKLVPKDTTASILVRFLEIKENDDVVLKKEEKDHDGYYEFLLPKGDLEKIMSDQNPKFRMYEYLVMEYNRSFMEFLMLEMIIDQAYVASVYISEYQKEFSYLESEYMDESSYLHDSVKLIYGEEVGMLSDFDYYPYGLVKEV